MPKNDTSSLFELLNNHWSCPNSIAVQNQRLVRIFGKEIIDSTGEIEMEKLAIAIEQYPEKYVQTLSLNLQDIIE